MLIYLEASLERHLPVKDVFAVCVGVFPATKWLRADRFNTRTCKKFAQLCWVNNWTYHLLVIIGVMWVFSGSYTPRGAGVPPFRHCSSLVHSLPHLLLFITFSLFPFLIHFTYFLLLSIRSLSTRIVSLRFQAWGRRRRPNLGLVCFVLWLCYLYCLVKIYSGILLYLV